jgi:hypothetical protein
MRRNGDEERDGNHDGGNREPPIRAFGRRSRQKYSLLARHFPRHWSSRGTPSRVLSKRRLG